MELLVRERQAPGVAVAAGTADGPVLSLSAGSLTYDSSPPVTDRTLYDLASLTKVVVAVSLVGVHLSRGRLSLEHCPGHYVPEYRTERWEGLTIADLLRHTARQPPWLSFFDPPLTRREVRRVLANLPPALHRGETAVYSDLDFLVLWDVLESLDGEGIDITAKREVFDRIGMPTALFRPAAEGREDSCAPTENCRWRQRMLRGEVHDENCAHLGGITPHAGLFASLSDVSAFATAVLRCIQGDDGWIAPEVMQTLTARSGPENCTFSPGWATPYDGALSAGDPLLLPHRLAASGRHPGARAFGMTGFTGGSISIDPDAGVWIVGLSNHVHPHRGRGGMPPFRADIADIVYEAVRVP